MITFPQSEKFFIMNLNLDFRICFKVTAATVYLLTCSKGGKHGKLDGTECMVGIVWHPIFFREIQNWERGKGAVPNMISKN
jgi:hypothetical protein